MMTMIDFEQAGEMAHKAHVKEAMFATNWKEWEIQIMSVHARQQALVHHRNLLSGKSIFILRLKHTTPD